MKKTIGITFSVPSSVAALYSNGIRQNVLYFNQLLNQTEHEVHLICDKPLIPNIPVFDYEKYKQCVMNTPKYKALKLDVLIQMGVTLSTDEIRQLRKEGCKIVLYKCGNEYIFEMEQAMYTSKENSMPAHAHYKTEQMVDEVWTIPQMDNSCRDYFALRYRCPVRIVPFVWSPLLLENMCKSLPNGGCYDADKQRSKNEFKVAIFEPNLNVVKYGIPPVYICENAYRKRTNKNTLKHVYVTNAVAKSKDYGKFDSKQFSRMTYALDLYRDKKISVESRYNAVVFMNLHADICVSHQWENPLNYLYLDLAWMGWPVLHNAHLCSDIGYFYADFDFESAGEQLNYILDTHPKIATEYREQNRQRIARFFPTNSASINEYNRYIQEL